MILVASGIEDGGVIPDRYTGLSAAPVSPALSWSAVPAGTRSFVLIMHDLEPAQNKSARMDVTHWLVWNIPGASTGLPEGVQAGALPDGTRQLSLSSEGYQAPGAPAGRYHHYVFELFALDTLIDVAVGKPAEAASVRMAVIDAMDGHVLGKTALVGRFHK